MTSAEKTEKQTVSAAGAANPYFKIKSGLFRCPPFFKKYLNPHCVKSVQIRSFFWSVFSRIRTVFSLNAGKYGPEKIRIWTLFTQCLGQDQQNRKQA